MNTRGKIDPDFEKEVRKTIEQAIAEGKEVAPLGKPFESLVVVIRDEAPASFLMEIESGVAGKTGYVVSAQDLEQ